MYGYIYITENLVNGKKYIGQHRGNFTGNYKGSGKLIRRAINKYGFDNFSVKILEECNSREELDQAEKKWILECNAVESDLYYNLAYGGSNGTIPLMLKAASDHSVRMKAGKSISYAMRIKMESGIDVVSHLHTHECAVKRMNTRIERYGSAFTDPDYQEKAKQARIKKYGSANGHMMSSEIRSKVGDSNKYIYGYDGLEFKGIKELEEYLHSKYPDLSFSRQSIRRKSYGWDVKKLRSIGEIKILNDNNRKNSGALEDYKLQMKYDGHIPVAED